MVLNTSGKQRRYGHQNIKLDTGNEVILPSECEKLLGVHVSQNLKWDQHIRLHRHSVAQVLTARLNALQKLSQYACFKTRKMVANGIFLSSLIYTIQLWGGSNQSLISCLQVIQNKAARFVAKQGPRTPIRTLLHQCGWLSVKQLAIYHNCLTVYKIRQHSKPVYFKERFGGVMNHEIEDPISSRTRLNSTGGIRLQMNRNQSDLEKQSFVNNSVKSWNSLPIEIRQCTSVPSFKRSLREWILQNVSIQ